jgi:hypothetical protein
MFNNGGCTPVHVPLVAGYEINVGVKDNFLSVRSNIMKLFFIDLDVVTSAMGSSIMNKL